MNDQASRFFLIGFTLLVVLTLFQQLFHPIKLAGLQGAFDKGQVPAFSKHQWFNGEYQQQSDRYLKYNTAFNGELVRLRNQLDYSIFGNINTILTLGKEKYIFDPNYILALNGTDLLTDSLQHAKTNAIKNTKLFLDSIHIPLYICIAPNKANHYSEFLSELIYRDRVTNRMFINSLLKQNQIPAIDFDQWFLTLKDTSSYPLVPKYGAHWSTYGASIAADSLLSLLQTAVSERLASFSFSGLELSDKARFTDDDYLASLNLMIKWSSPVMAYPKLNFKTGKKPKVLIISDSFIWNFYDLEVIQNCFSSASQVRYYNKTIYDGNRKLLGPVTDLTPEMLKQCDYIVILSADPSLKDFGFGFFETVSQLACHE